MRDGDRFVRIGGFRADYSGGRATREVGTGLIGGSFDGGDGDSDGRRIGAASAEWCGAARALNRRGGRGAGVSRDSFERHVMAELHLVRIGRRLLVPTRELERWIEREMAIPLVAELSRRATGAPVPGTARGGVASACNGEAETSAGRDQSPTLALVQVRERGRCDCIPSFEASAYARRDGKKVRRTFATSRRPSAGAPRC